MRQGFLNRAENTLQNLLEKYYSLIKNKNVYDNSSSTVLLAYRKSRKTLMRWYVEVGHKNFTDILKLNDSYIENKEWKAEQLLFI